MAGGIAWKYTPPAKNALVVLAAATPLATEAGAKLVLAEAQAQIPVEYGIAKASGRIVMDGADAIVTFGRDDDGDYEVTGFEDDGAAVGREKHAPSNEYIVPLHERIDDHHPNGGNSKFEERAMHQKAPEVAAAMATTVRKALAL